MKQKKKDAKSIININQQILKCRDDKEPVILSRLNEQNDGAEPFKLADGYKCSWLKKDDAVGPAKLRPRIEPWLTALFQSEHLALLVGSGLSHAVHHIATIGTKKSMQGMGTIEFNHVDKEIKAEAKRSAAAAGREEGNFEDQIRVANELLRGLEIIGTNKAIEGNAEDLRKDLERIMDDFAASILKGETELITS
jgi:hypothetical protein